MTEQPRDDPDARLVAEFLTALEDLTGDERYTWALDTLTGIYDTVDRTQRVTPNQRRAVENIARAGQDREPRRRWRGR